MKDSSPKITVLTMFAATVLFTSWPAVAQSPPSKSATTWQELGFNQLPEGFSTYEIPLFEGLNEARGTWSFEGETTDGKAGTPLKGSLQVMGNPKSGMLPGWKLVWGWPADDPGYAIHYTIMASPRQTGFDLMLFRVGPVKESRSRSNQTQTSANHVSGNMESGKQNDYLDRIRLARPIWWQACGKEF